MGPGKAKQFLILCAKMAIIGVTLFFIRMRLKSADSPDWHFLTVRMRAWGFPGIIVILALTFLNRYLEILKWQSLAGLIRKISLGEATRQVLASMTLSVFTPAGIGEYAGKAFFYERTASRKIIFLNLICNGVQMLVSVFFGIAGLLYFNGVFAVLSAKMLSVLIIGTMALIAALILSRNLYIKGWSVTRLYEKCQTLPATLHRRLAVLSVLRYVCFSHQYLLLLRCFGADAPYFTLMSGITSVYLLSSIIPTFQFIDFAVKGGVALLFLGLAGVDNWSILCVTTVMWLLNVVIPVAVGSCYVAGYKWKPA